MPFLFKQFKGSCKVCGKIGHKAEDKNEGKKNLLKAIQEQKQRKEKEHSMFYVQEIRALEVGLPNERNKQRYKQYIKNS